MKILESLYSNSALPVRHRVIPCVIDQELFLVQEDQEQTGMGFSIFLENEGKLRYNMRVLLLN